MNDQHILDKKCQLICVCIPHEFFSTLQASTCFSQSISSLNPSPDSLPKVSATLLPWIINNGGKQRWQFLYYLASYGLRSRWLFVLSINHESLFSTRLECWMSSELLHSLMCYKDYLLTHHLSLQINSHDFLLETFVTWFAERINGLTFAKVPSMQLFFNCF